MAISVPHRTRGAIVSDALISGYAPIKILKINISSAPTGAEQDTGFDLPTKGIVLDVWLDVTTAEATGTTKTLDVGLLASESGGDADGFLSSVSVASTGVKRGIATYTTGSNETFVASTTRGALLVDFFAGSDVAGDSGNHNQKPHILNGTAKSVVYDADDTDWVEFRGVIWILYIDLVGV